MALAPTRRMRSALRASLGGPAAGRPAALRQLFRLAGPEPVPG